MRLSARQRSSQDSDPPGSARRIWRSTTMAGQPATRIPPQLGSKFASRTAPALVALLLLPTLGCTPEQTSRTSEHTRSTAEALTSSPAFAIGAPTVWAPLGFQQHYPSVASNGTNFLV